MARAKPAKRLEGGLRVLLAHELNAGTPATAIAVALLTETIRWVRIAEAAHELTDRDLRKMQRRLGLREARG
jgi:hypothetical protein